MAGVRARLPGHRLGWTIPAAAAAALIVLPVAVVVADGLTPTAEVWRRLWATNLAEMVTTTLVLLVAVAFGTLLLGGGLAWLVTAYRFPGRSLFGWLLILPLAMPAYILGFVFLSLLDYPGPIQTTLRSVFGPHVWFPDVRSVAGAAAVLTLTLYPYVYLLARSALTEQAAATFEAARVLGAGRLRAARRVVLPMARPSLAAGLTLVMMETLTDFATVQYFNVQTVSVGVYQVWKGMFQREAATELAGLVLVFAVAVIVAERGLRGRARYHQRGGRGRGLPAAALTGIRGWAAAGVCVAVLAAAFLIPLAQLLSWSGARGIRGIAGVFDTRLLTYFANSALVAALAAAGCVGVGLLVANAARLGGGRFTGAVAQLSTVGYAVPGVVVAIGVLTTFSALDEVLEGIGVSGGTGLLVTSSLVGILYAYVVRFAALGYTSVDASLQKITPAMTMSALTLGAPPRRVLYRVHVPLARAGVGVAFVLVLIDAIKELPIVLLLRPFGFTTLSIWVYELASESRWSDAGLPALAIVAAALVPVLVLFRPATAGRVPVDAEKAGVVR
ncbi:MAG: ABC transporter permease subunit [Streptosporangiales bacterium]|nr:ABC transporter permease subunit [Streptosporangiales bacterium]